MRRLTNTICLLTALVMLCTGCSKIQRGKWAYERGNYEKAIALLETALKTEATNQTAKQYLILARSGLLTDRADKAITDNQDYEKAITLLDEALGLDEKNADAQSLMAVSIEKLITRINADFKPAKAWGKIVPITTLILKYQPDNKKMWVVHSEAVYYLNNEALGVPFLLAVKKARTRVTDDPFLEGKAKLIADKTARFKALFDRYQQALLSANLGAWKGLIHSRHRKEVEVDVSEFIKKNDDKIRSVNDYFTEIAKDPQKYGNPDGAEVVCIEPLSASQAFVHFQYNDLPKVLKMEIAAEKGALKLHREEDSEIKKADL